MGHYLRSQPIARVGLNLILAGLSLISACQSPNIVESPPETISSPPQTEFDRLATLEQRLYQQVNEYRQSQKRPPLQLSTYASLQARIHSELIAQGKIPFNSQDFKDRINAISTVIPFQKIAVNLASVSGSADIVPVILKGWIDRPSQREVLTGSFEQTGIGIAQNTKGEYFITQFFLAERSKSAENSLLTPPAKPSAREKALNQGKSPFTEPFLATLEQTTWTQVNRYRQSRGLPPLQLNARMSEIARQHAQAMAKKKATFSHNGFDKRANAIKSMMPVRAVGENLAYIKGYPDVVTTAVEGWIKSPGHRKNMEGNYNLTGIGIAKNLDGEYYFSQLFALEP